jgi:hypothetical protein
MAATAALSQGTNPLTRERTARGLEFLATELPNYSGQGLRS